MKIGIEVEGRLIGLKTLFVDYVEWLLQYNTVIDNATTHNVQQIYICDLENKLDLYAHNLKQLSNNLFITVECTELLQYPPNYISIMLNVQNNSIFKLNRNDQVKFVNGQHVKSTTIRNMTETLPIEFEGDIQL